MTKRDKSHAVTGEAKRDERDNNPIGLSRLSRPAPPQDKQWVWAVEGDRLTDGVRVRISLADRIKRERARQSSAAQFHTRARTHLG